MEWWMEGSGWSGGWRGVNRVVDGGEWMEWWMEKSGWSGGWRGVDGVVDGWRRDCTNGGEVQNEHCVERSWRS